MKFSRRSLIMGLTTTAVSLLSSLVHFRKVTAQSLLKRSKADESANLALNFNEIYNYFLEKAKVNPLLLGEYQYPPLLYWGKNQKHNNSPFHYRKQRGEYTRHLQKGLNEKGKMGIQADDSFNAYPKLGQLPKIDEQGLDFLDCDIKEACVCLGTFSEGEFKTKWLGRDALDVGEFWSATKIIPLTYVFAQISQKQPNIDFSQLSISKGNESCQTEGSSEKELLVKMAEDMISYDKDDPNQEGGFYSNKYGATFKRFSTQIVDNKGTVLLEKWLKDITGNSNQNFEFRGRYGANPDFDYPVISFKGKVILCSDPNKYDWDIKKGSNTVSAYDLTRILSMIGWHNYLPQNAQLPDMQENGYDALISILGMDSARLTDLSIEKLGLENYLINRVILSKLGNGFTSIRRRGEAVYLGLFQFTDRRNNQFYTLSICLKGGRKAGSYIPKDPDLDNPEYKHNEEIKLDARMATEVTRILNQVLSC